MATVAEIQIPVRVYGYRTTSFLLRTIAALVPLFGVHFSVWLANRILHWLLWARVGHRWLRIGDEIDMKVSQ